MPSGLLGKASLAANTDTVLYTAPAGTVTTTTVNFCNTTSAAINVRLAVTSAAAVAAADYLEYDFSLPANGVLERTGIVLSPAEVLFARASSAGVTVQARGFEEPL
nr:hypothetical protein [uncultured Pseudomonas sp.]